MAKAMKKRAKKKPLTQAQMAHLKFLQKMGVTKKQLKDRKIELDKLFAGEENSRFHPDSLRTVRQAYDEE